MKKIIIPVLFLAGLCLFSVPLHARTIRFVQYPGVYRSNNSGESWANSISGLQEAINMSVYGDTIFVAKSVYGGPIVMKEGVKIYGGFRGIQDGFQGTDTLLSQRDWVTNITNLRSYGAYPVVYNDNNGLTSAAVLDGFRIIVGEYPIDTGSCMYNNLTAPSIVNCTFFGGFAYKKGGGVYNVNCAPVFTNCSFVNCRSWQDGGAMYNDNASPVINNCSFSFNNVRRDNTLTSGRGAAIFNASGSAPVITHCTFNNNTPERQGGAIFNGTSSQAMISNCLFRDNRGPGAGLYNEQSSPTITGCTFVANTGGDYMNANPSTIANMQASPVIRNCIIWGNQVGVVDVNATPVIEYSIVQGGYAGTGNLNTEPYFKGNYELQLCSPAIDAGSSAHVPAGNITDLAGRQRIRSEAVDMGVYEFRMPQPGPGNILYINATINEGVSDVSGSSWPNAIQQLSEALQYARKYAGNWTAANPLKIYVAAGMYLPAYRPDMLCTPEAADRNNGFGIVSHVQLYGGFDPANGIDDLSDNRIMGASGSILSGDLGNNNNAADNSYHVITLANVPATTSLDGFTITGGKADGTGGLDNRGGAVFIDNASPVINRCIITNNDAADRAGGIFCLGNSSPLIAGCTLSANTAGIHGAAMFIENPGTPTITRSVFSGNSTRFGGALYIVGTATVTACHFVNNTGASYGGAVYTGWGPVVFTNCAFTGNKTVYGGGGGGALFIHSAVPVITNCSFSANTADYGGAIHNYNTTTATVRNCIIWGNNSAIYSETTASASVQNSLVQGGYAGTGNLNTDPQFMNSSTPAGVDGVLGTIDDGLRLQPCSPAVNVGDNASLDAGITTDLSGITRTQFATVDLGAYEANTVADATHAPLANSNTEVTAWQFTNRPTLYGDNCATLIASLTGDGQPTSVNGNTTVKIWIEPAQSKAFIKRHYEITPQDMDAATATGIVTLYFTQEEFDTFNALNGLKLPQHSSDAMGKSHLLIEKRSGTSSDNSGLPNTYTGNAVTIDPDDANIVWNATALRWEVTFNVTGFSGFFVKTNIAPLPLRLLQFTAEEKTCNTELHWKTSSEVNVSRFEVEESMDGVSFNTIRSVPAKNNPGESNYTVTLSLAHNTTHYRLKMVDLDGTVTYSPVAVITAVCTGTLQIYPNPAHNKLYVHYAVIGSQYVLYDNAGKKLRSGRINNVLHQVSVAGLARGIYYISVIDANRQTRMMKFVKE